MNPTFTIISGLGAIGLTYGSCPYWDREDGRGSLHITLWFVKVIIRIGPFKDITKKGYGTATSYYGFFWWPKVHIWPRFYWVTLK